MWCRYTVLSTLSNEDLFTIAKYSVSLCCIWTQDLQNSKLSSWSGPANVLLYAVWLITLLNLFQNKIGLNSGCYLSVSWDMQTIFLSFSWLRLCNSILLAEFQISPFSAVTYSKYSEVWYCMHKLLARWLKRNWRTVDFKYMLYGEL